VTFSQDIKALIAQNCEGCHNGMSANGGLVLSGHQNTAAAALKWIINRPNDAKRWRSIVNAAKWCIERM
jgi:hypothetical protein